MSRRTAASLGVSLAAALTVALAALPAAAEPDNMPAAVQLAARQVVDVTAAFGAELRFTPERLAALHGVKLPPNLPEDRLLEVTQASMNVLTTLGPALRDAYAQALASRLEPEQLLDAATFFASPPGHSYLEALFTALREPDLSNGSVTQPDPALSEALRREAAKSGISLPQGFGFPLPPPLSK